MKKKAVEVAVRIKQRKSLVRSAWGYISGEKNLEEKSSGGQEQDSFYVNNSDGRFENRNNSLYVHEFDDEVVDHLRYIGDQDGDALIVGEQIGRGGYSKCYIAQGVHGGELYAVKMISTKPKQLTSLSNIEQEVQVHKKLHHPFIVDFLRLIREDGGFILVLEYCSNRTLNDLIAENGKMLEDSARRMLRQILSAVHYLHGRLIHHGDLKLRNIFLDHRMVPKLGDFGFAKQLKSATETRTSPCGTPAYMAPEIILKPCSFGLPADIWSFGVITYTLLYGRTAFGETTLSSTYKRIRHHDLRFPLVYPEIPDDAITLIQSMLGTVPHLRPTTSELIQNTWLNHSLGDRSRHSKNSSTKVDIRVIVSDELSSILSRARRYDLPSICKITEILKRKIANWHHKTRSIEENAA